MSKKFVPIKSKEFNWKVFSFYILIVGLISILFFMPRFSLPLLMAYVVTLILNPLLPFFYKMGIKRLYALLILFILLFVLLIVPSVYVIPVISDEMDFLQVYIPKIGLFLKTKYLWIQVFLLDKFNYTLGDEHLLYALNLTTVTSKKVLLSSPQLLAQIMEWALIIPIYAFFLLKDGDKFKKFALSFAPNAIFEKLYYIAYQIHRKVSDYIFAKFLEAAVVGIIITLGLMIIDLRFSVLLGVVAALTNVIPYVGPIVGAVPGLIIAAIEYGVGPEFMSILLLYLIANVIDIFLVFPLLVSKIVDLHPMSVIMSVIIGSQFFGVLGMIVSIPLAAALKLIMQEIFNARSPEQDF